MAEAWADQADGLRRMLSGVPLQVVSLTSAHGDAGRPWAVLNLAAALRLAGVGVLVIDAAAGHPGGLTSQRRSGHELADVLAGGCALEAAILPGPEGIPVLPARTGVADLAGSSAAARRLVSCLQALPGGIEVLLVNLPSGETGDQVSPALLDHELVLSVAPNSDSITSTYRLIKRLALSSGKREFRLLVTGVTSVREAQRVHRNLSDALARWAGVQLVMLGVMPADQHLRHAASQGRALVASEPAAAAASSFRRMADSLILWRSRGLGGPDRSSFFRADAAGLASHPMRG